MQNKGLKAQASFLICNEGDAVGRIMDIALFQEVSMWGSCPPSQWGITNRCQGFMAIRTFSGCWTGGGIPSRSWLTVKGIPGGSWCGKGWQPSFALIIVSQGGSNRGAGDRGCLLPPLFHPGSTLTFFASTFNCCGVLKAQELLVLKPEIKDRKSERTFVHFLVDQPKSILQTPA